jgi:mRNA interferase MazF
VVFKKTAGFACALRRKTGCFFKYHLSGYKSSQNILNDLLNCVNIIPLTSLKPGRTVYPNEVFLPANSSGLPNDSIALYHQIRTIDKKRLSLEYGAIAEEAVKNDIVDAICFQLGIVRSL